MNENRISPKVILTLTCHISFLPVFGSENINVCKDYSCVDAAYHCAGVYKNDIGEGKVAGMVVDGQNRPVDFASVALLNVSDSSFIAGGVTDENGKFEIPCKLDKVVVKVSCVGYATVSKLCDTGSIGTINLPENVRSLQNVVVKGNRKIFNMTHDGLVTNVSGTVLSEAGTANNVIAQVPSVYGSDGNYSVYGKGAAVIYINGKKMLDSGELERLSSKDIASVTLDNNPGSKYDATVRAVINIKTVKKQGDGFSGTLYSMYSQRHYGSLGEGANLNWRKGGLNIFTNLSYSMSNSYSISRSDKTILKDGKEWNLCDEKKLPFKIKTSTVASLGFSYDFNENNSIGARYGTNYMPEAKGNSLSDQNVAVDGERMETMYYHNVQNYKDTFRQFANAYYVGKIGAWSISLNNDLYLTRGKILQDVAVENSVTGESQVKNRQESNNTMFATKLAVSRPIGKGRVEAGYELTFTNHKQTFDNVGLDVAGVDDRIKENNYAGFMSVSYPLGTLQMKAGARYEHTVSNFYKSGKLVDEQSRSYDKLFPNVGVSFPVGKSTLNLNYVMKIRRPSYSELSANVQYNDAFTYETGNPNLMSEITHDVTLSAVYKWIYVSASYQHVEDARINVYELQHGDGAPVCLYRRINYPSLNMYVATLSLTPKFGLWSPRLSMTLNGQDFKMQSCGRTLRHTNPIFSTKFYNSFSLPAGFILTADVLGHTSGDRAVIHEKPSYQLDMGLSKNLRQWTFQLQATDIFHTARNSMDYYGDSSVERAWMYSDTRGVKLTVRYRFNSTDNKYKGSGAGASEKSRF